MNTERADPHDLAELRTALAGHAGSGQSLGWDGVRTFEAQHDIALPEPYRSVVAEISDECRSGPPAYGLLPLAELPGDWGDDPEKRNLAAPFPLTEAWVWEADPRPYKAIEAQLAAVHDHGSVVLGTDGCGMYWHLIVSGPHRGHIWHITGEGAAPFGAQFGYTTASPGFTGWIRHWAAGKSWFDTD